jgi:hypothetical protein
LSVLNLVSDFVKCNRPIKKDLAYFCPFSNINPACQAHESLATLK